MTITPSDSLDLLIAHGPPDATDFAKQIAGLPGAYYAGLDEAYKRRTQDAFQGVAPTKTITGPDGQLMTVPNWDAMGQTLITAGGTPAVESYVKLAGLQQQQDKIDYQRRAENDVHPPSGGFPGVPPSTGSTGSLSPPTARISVPPGSYSPAGTIAGEPVTPSIRSLLPSGFGEDARTKLGVRIQGELGLPPGTSQDDPLTPEQYARGQQIAQQAAAVPGRVAQAPAVAPGGPAATVPGVVPAMGGGITPGGRTDEQQLFLIGRKLSSGMLDPNQAKNYLAEANALRERMALTPESKDYSLSVMQDLQAGRPIRSKEQWLADKKFAEGRSGEQGTIWAKKGEAIGTSGAESAREIPKLQLAKQFMADPNFYSGPGEKHNEMYKSILASIDPSQANAALPQQAFKKVVSDSLTSSIKGLAQSGAGRVQLAEIRIMERAAANPSNNPAANRLLVELATRAHQQNVGIADLASQYKGGNLDPQFDEAMRAYIKQHPLVNPQELKDPARIAPPIFPSLAAAKAKGIHNSWVESTDGKQFFIP